MSTLCSVSQFTALTHLHQTPTKASLRTTSPFLQKFKACRLNRGTNEFIGSSRPLEFSPFQKCDSIVSCTMNVTAGESDGHRRRLNVDQTVVKVRKIWENFPEPVKSFPWFKTLENFVQVIFYLVCAVGKYLCIPLLTISSLSELSYCAHERKMVLIPVPLVTGIAIAGVLRDTILELSPHIKEGEFPWHLIAIASFFTLLKLPGPYYPYWGRIIIPHFANGGLLRTLCFAFLWYRRRQGSRDINEILPQT